MLVKCAACGVLFKRKPHSVNRAKQRFCSLRCKANEEARFWRSVLKTATCWLWVGTVKKGYGRFRPKRRSVLAHRYSWELHHGKIPNGLCACHNCPGGDNPRCVNPAHLFLGTRGDNNRDAAEKHRIAGVKRRHKIGAKSA